MGGFPNLSTGLGSEDSIKSHLSSSPNKELNTFFIFIFKYT